MSELAQDRLGVGEGEGEDKRPASAPVFPSGGVDGDDATFFPRRRPRPAAFWPEFALFLVMSNMALIKI